MPEAARRGALCRRVCLLGSAAFAACIEPSVLGRDPALNEQDAAAHADAAADARVVGRRDADAACPDCDAASPASETAPAGAPCLMNLSLEGTPQLSTPPSLQNLLGVTFAADPWQPCVNTTIATTPSVVDQTVQDPSTAVPFPSAYDGATYVALREGEGVRQAICALGTAGTLQFGLRFSASLWQTNHARPDPTLLTLQVWADPGFVTTCPQNGTVTDVVPIMGSGWNDYCATVNWADSFYTLGFSASGSGVNSPTLYVLVDDLRVVAACP